MKTAIRASEWLCQWLKNGCYGLTVATVLVEWGILQKTMSGWSVQACDKFHIDWTQKDWVMGQVVWFGSFKLENRHQKLESMQKIEW